MNRVNVFNFRDELSTYLDTVVKTDIPLIIEKRGKPVVMVVPYKGEGEPNYEKYFGFMAGDENGEKFLRNVRRSKKEFTRIRSLRER